MHRSLGWSTSARSRYRRDRPPHDPCNLGSRGPPFLCTPGRGSFRAGSGDPLRDPTPSWDPRCIDTNDAGRPSLPRDTSESNRTHHRGRLGLCPRSPMVERGYSGGLPQPCVVRWYLDRHRCGGPALVRKEAGSPLTRGGIFARIVATRTGKVPSPPSSRSGEGRTERNTESDVASRLVEPGGIGAGQELRPRARQTTPRTGPAFRRMGAQQPRLDGT